MARGAGEPSTKRAKVDEADDEEEDPLVRRKEELVLGAANARAKGKELEERLVREAKEEAERLTREAEEPFAQDLREVCAAFEAKNKQHLRRLPSELWQKINLHQNDLLALAMTCRFLRDQTKDLGWKMETNLTEYVLLDASGKVASHSMGWFCWVCGTMEIQPGFDWGDKRVKGAVNEGDLVNYAALQGSVEILRWLIEEKGWEPNWRTGLAAGLGGSIEVLEYLVDWGYEFDEETCYGVAQGGCLEALKFLRGLDPPCPWSRRGCREEASERDHQHIVKWIDQQVDESDWEDWGSDDGDMYW